MTNLRIGALSIEKDRAVRHLANFARSPRSAFVAYDLAGHVARESGRLNEVGPWSLLLARALNGVVSLQGLNEIRPMIPELAGRIAAVDPTLDLDQMTPNQVATVVDLACVGVPSAWAPLITKVAALYRPRSVPILDDQTALAYGLPRRAFSNRTVKGRPLSRSETIAAVVVRRAQELREQRQFLDDVRKEAARFVSQVEHLTRLRTCDIVVWTEQVEDEFWDSEPIVTTVDEPEWMPTDPAAHTEPAGTQA